MTVESSPFVPPAPPVHQKDLPLWRLLWRMTRSTLSIWPDYAFETLTVRNRVMGIETLVVNDPEGVRHVLTTGYDHMPGTRVPYTTNVPLARAIEDDVLLVHTWQGQPLPREHGGPVRMITPKLYAWKGAKFVRSIEFLDKDKLGFWEVRGYSNTADPWTEDRFS